MKLLIDPENCIFISVVHAEYNSIIIIIAVLLQ